MSVGVASTKLVAKIASDLRKPDGLVVVPPGEEAAFLRAAADRRGCGASARRPRRRWPSTPCARSATSRRCPRTSSCAGSASTGRRSSSAPAGSIPTRSTTATRPSRSATSTPSTSTRSDPEVIERTLLAMADGVAGRLRSAGVRAGTVTVKIRDSAFRTITRQRTLAEPTDLTEPIFRAALELARPEVRGMRVRLLGVTASNLGEREQLALFESVEPRRRRAVEAADALRRRYGERAVTRARLLGAGLPAPFERDPRNPLDRRARGVAGPADGPTPAGRERGRLVTA